MFKKYLWDNIFGYPVTPIQKIKLKKTYVRSFVMAFLNTESSTRR